MFQWSGWVQLQNKLIMIEITLSFRQLSQYKSLIENQINIILSNIYVSKKARETGSMILKFFLIRNDKNSISKGQSLKKNI